MTHVPLGSKQDCFQTVICVWNVLRNSSIRWWARVGGVKKKRKRTPSALITSISRLSTCSSPSLVYRRIAHRLCMGSIIFDEMLQANANRVVLEYISIVRLSACWAAAVMLDWWMTGRAWSLSRKAGPPLRGATLLGKPYLSASSRITTFCLPAARFTFFWANSLILFLTTSIPLVQGEAESVESSPRSATMAQEEEGRNLSSEAFSSRTPSR